MILTRPLFVFSGRVRGGWLNLVKCLALDLIHSSLFRTFVAAKDSGQHWEVSRERRYKARQLAGGIC